MTSPNVYGADGSVANFVSQEKQLCTFLRDYPRICEYKYTEKVALDLTDSLFHMMVGGNHEYLKLLFPNGKIPADKKLREAQGAVEGSEYSEAARGKRCGHILKSGEASYMCRTCSVDETCCLCSRCYHATNHEGHHIRISISSGNSGCCDCGDEEAWKVPMICNIHSELNGSGCCSGKEPEAAQTPPDLVKSMEMTIGRVLDYICDVISCSPEQLRLAKTKETIEKDARDSVLQADKYCGEETIEAEQQYCLIVWNDEKHTLRDVQDQIARACKKRSQEAYNHAIETDSVGRSILVTSTDLPDLLRMAKKLEEIRVTITIRSARDTFREQMCATMVDWLSDISGCSVGNDHKLLLHTVCEQMLQPWNEGSSAANKTVGKNGISDEDNISDEIDHQRHLSHPLLREWQRRFNGGQIPDGVVGGVDELDIVELITEDEEGEEEEEDDDDDEDDDMGDTEMADIDEGEDGDLLEARDDNGLARPAWTIQPGINDNGDIDFEISLITTDAAAPPPPPPPPAQPLDAAEATATTDAPAPAPARILDITLGPQIGANVAVTRQVEAPPAAPLLAPATLPATVPSPPQVAAAAGMLDIPPSEAESADTSVTMTGTVGSSSAHPEASAIPKTPGLKAKDERPRPGKYWTEVPKRFYHTGDSNSAADDIFSPVRLDRMIMFDLRMWKKLRNDLRSFYISRIASVPEYKLILGRRFAAFYTTLAQLYLIGDREPDHSIINLSLQMFTTASITKELVEKANFLTHLFAILYTFLTKRQVNYPWEVNSSAVLAFDSGSVTNRRMYHFYMDVKHLFESEYVKKCLRTEERYLLQFLDLVKLHQGIGPNTRAVGEHVEYETDTWITASLVTREINRMTFKFSLAFADITPDDVEAMESLKRSIRITAKTLILHCLGAERQRFVAAEIKNEVKFKSISDYEFDPALEGVNIVDFLVHKEHISFHHALHYTLSWLIERGRSMDAEELRSLLSFTFEELLQPPRTMGSLYVRRHNLPAEDFLMNMFDFPLRVCSWLAQIKTNMWVRNGISLRHQAASYRGVASRDVCHQRDLLMLQTAAVTCDPSRVLASIVDRFHQTQWMHGIFEINIEGQDSKQHIDVVEDMIHLLITILSDRCALVPAKPDSDPALISMRRDLIHVLCLRPLSFSDICNKLSDRYQDHPEFNHVLKSLSKFEFREGISDVGSFELKPEYASEIDIFNSHYTRNQREEAEAAYRKSMAALTGKKADDIVYEPNLMEIPSGVFKDLAHLTRTGMFAQIIYYCLSYSLQPESVTSSMPSSRIEVYLNSVLHLILIAVAEDHADEKPSSDEKSFIRRALQQTARMAVRQGEETASSIVGLLRFILLRPEYSSCHGKVNLILSKMRQKQPALTLEKLGAPTEMAADSNDDPATTAEEERERKKKAALSRAAKVMAQFQKQQQEFLGKQTEIDWGSDLSDDDDDDEMKDPGSEQKKTWKFPSDTCLQCQEKTDDRKLFGTFAMFTESRVVRATDLQNKAVVREVMNLPGNLDEQMDRSHPSGISGENKTTVTKFDSSGQRQEFCESNISEGFPNNQSLSGPVSVSCGHLMHYSCFKTYYDAMTRRQAYQIARHHPEDLNRHEFVCPLCKALCNAFVPIIWKPREESYPHVLKAESDMTSVLERETSDPFYNKTSDSEDASARKGEVDLRPIHIRSAVSSFAPPLAQYVTETYGRIDVDDTEALAKRLQELADDASQSAVAPSAYTKDIMSEMVKVYETFNVSLRSQEFIQSQPCSYARARCFNDTMIRAVAFSIAATEIQQRGVGAANASMCAPKVFVDNVPEQTMTYLKILAETTRAYLSINCLQPSQPSISVANSQFQHDACQQLKQLFICEYPDPADTNKIPPALALDGFVLLTDYAYCLSEAHNIEIAHLIRLCYLAEVVRVVQRIINNIPADKWYMRLHSIDVETPDNVKAFGSFCKRLMDMTLDAKDSGDAGTNDNLENHGFEQDGLETLEGIYSFVQKYALAYLRKTVILMHAKYGVDFSVFEPSDPAASELSRLTEALQVPTFNEVCAALLPSNLSCGWPDTIEQVVSGWIRHYLSYPVTSCDPVRDDRGWLAKQRSFVPMALAHPAVFELIGLPREFDTLIDVATRRRCPTSGQEIQDATICLLCGEIFCAQSTCCLQEVPLGGSSRTSIGGAQNHMRKCQGSVGLFINIRKCCSFYLFRRSGSFAQAPYLDCYGETDMGLRHGRQLFLNQKRYDKLRTLFLAHGVPSFIARKLEAEVNNGGWETI